MVVRVEQELAISLELPPANTAQCSATIEIEYTQRDTLVNVEGTVDTADCAASSGEYRLLVSVRDEKLELNTLEFVGSWQRSDARPVTFEADYPIGGNVDLLRVRARETRCTCADTPREPD